MAEVDKHAGEEATATDAGATRDSSGANAGQGCETLAIRRNMTTIFEIWKIRCHDSGMQQTRDARIVPRMLV